VTGSTRRRWSNYTFLHSIVVAIVRAPFGRSGDAEAPEYRVRIASTTVRTGSAGMWAPYALSETGSVILVVEGPSAAGKTTWLSQWDPALVVTENGRVEPADDSAIEKAEFWAGLNAARWHQALEIEKRCGTALCDTDPLKLHYDYCRARAGIASWSQFDAGIEACSAAIADRRLGISDCTLCALPDGDTLDARKRNDPTRTRHNFDVHRGFGPALRDWYQTLEMLDPGRVRWSFPVSIPNGGARTATTASTRLDACRGDGRGCRGGRNGRRFRPHQYRLKRRFRWSATG